MAEGAPTGRAGGPSSPVDAVADDAPVAGGGGRRRADTRERLLRAAEAVFAERGFHASSVDDVAAAAGFTKGAVYSNFASKEELFLALVDRQVDHAVAAVERILEAPADRRATLLAERFAGAAVLGPGWFLLEAEFLLYAARNEDAREPIVQRSRRTHARVTDLVARHLADLGVPAPGAAARDVARILIATTDGLAQATAADPEVGKQAGRLLASTLDALVRAAVEGEEGPPR